MAQHCKPMQVILAAEGAELNCRRWEACWASPSLCRGCGNSRFGCQALPGFGYRYRLAFFLRAEKACHSIHDDNHRYS
jgi:hypothetical protein